MSKLAYMLGVILLISVWTNASTSEPKAKTSEEFDSYVNGALNVYSQFNTPTKEESERFYAFLVQKWTSVNCVAECDKIGYMIAKEYTKQKQIKLVSEK